MAKAKTDKYVSILGTSITMDVINTLKFEEILIGLNIFDKVALEIVRIEYEPTVAVYSDLDDDGDYFGIALTSSSSITTFNLEETQVIDSMQVATKAFTAAGYNHYITPIVREFNEPILVAPRPLYVAASSGGMTVVGSANIRIYFRIVPLTPAEYLELIETRRAFG